MHSEKVLTEDVVIYSMPEQAARVMKKLYEYYQYRFNFKNVEKKA
ncbi:MAG: hypothetical protein ACTSQI_04010 [Candidatus Helarchaeota archaeon]